MALPLNKTIKKIGKKTLTVLYYILIFPALFHGIYKIGKWIFTPKSKLIKDGKNFERAEDFQEDRLEDGNHAKEALKKTKRDDIWIAKQQPKVHTCNELIVGEAFRLMLGPDCAPKYRAMFDENGKIYSISKLLDIEQISNKKAQKNYKARVKQYKKFTSHVKNFEYMLAVCLLFGKIDLHSGNWGVITAENGKKKAATLDHGETLGKISEDYLYHYLYNYEHRKEKFLNKRFLKACKEVIEKFDSEYQEIEKSCRKGVVASKQVVGFFKQSDVPTTKEVMKTLKYNRDQLQNLRNHIKCEMDISANNAEKLKKHAGKFTPDYKSFGILSLQNRRDGCLPNRAGLKFFIQHSKFIDIDDINKNEEEEKELTSSQQDLMAAYEAGLAEAGLKIKNA